MRIALLRLGKSHYHVLFTIKPALFLGFIYINYDNSYSQRYNVINGVRSSRTALAM